MCVSCKHIPAKKHKKRKRKKKKKKGEKKPERKKKMEHWPESVTTAHIRCLVWMDGTEKTVSWKQQNISSDDSMSECFMFFISHLIAGGGGDLGS